VKSKNLFASAFLLFVCIFFSIPANARADIKVYDANGQFLGILLDQHPDYLNVFIPSLLRNVPIDIGSGVIAEHGALLFETSNCTGSSYVGLTYQYSVFVLEGRYFTGEESISPILKSITSHRAEGGGVPACYPDNSSVLVVPAKEIMLPFNAPVALPMRFEYQPQAAQSASVPAIGTVGLIVVSILFSISAIIRIKRRERISVFEAIRRMVIFKM
jgi:hypothetical protein